MTCSFPKLETDRLVLRALTQADTEFIYKHLSNEAVCRYLFDAEPVKTMDEAKDIIDWFMNAKSHNRWAIVRREDGQVMGTCGFHNWDKTNNIAEVGYDLGAEYWGQGFMQEAMTVALKSGFENMGLNRVQAFVALDNQKSCSLLERLGFKQEGIFRDKHLFRGKYYDHYMFSLLRREWYS